MDQKDLALTRRTLLATTAFVPLSALTASAQARETALSPDQRRILEAFVDRIAPGDAGGPGALECGAANYIDRTLAEFNAAEKPAFVEGLSALDAAARAAHKTPFADLAPDLRDQILTSFDEGAVPSFAAAKPFFTRARRLTIEGMFSDPYYGGNRNFAGWDLIGYPGPRLAVAPEDQKLDHPPKPYRRSAWGNQSGH